MQETSTHTKGNGGPPTPTKNDRGRRHRGEKKEKLERRVQKAVVYVPGMAKEDQEDTDTRNTWTRQCQAAKRQAAKAMKKIIQIEKNNRIKKLVNKLREEGGAQARGFYTKIRNA